MLRYQDVYTTLVNAHGLSETARRTVLHHQAKALRNLQQYSDAITICESILKQFPNPSTKLLLARLLIHEKDKCEQAKNVLFDLLEEAKASPDIAEITVTLAAIELLCYQQVKQWLPEAIIKYGSLVSDFIVKSAMRGFNQAFQTFVFIGRYLRYNDKDLFVSIFNQLPSHTIENCRNVQERAAWGDILLSASEAFSAEQRESLAADALQFLESVEKPNEFIRQQRAHALFLLKRFEDAVTVLRPLVSTTPNPWNRYWLSKALFNLEELDEALALVDQALADQNAKNYQAALLEHRWAIKKLQNDVNAIEDLQNAHDCCHNQRHKTALAAKLAIEKGIDNEGR